MDVRETPRGRDLRERLAAFLEAEVLPAEPVYEQQRLEAGDPHAEVPLMDELKTKARSKGLWNLFHPDPRYGPGLSCVEYAPLAEASGRSHIAAEVMNCSAPDSGNMELLSLFGSDEQKEQWLEPLLDGRIRSAFAMTEPDVASSDARNVQLRIERDGDEYVLNGRKWWITGGMRSRCRVFIVMGKTDPQAPASRQQSMVLVPRETAGLKIVRDLSIFGYNDQEGHAEIEFDEVRVPVGNLLGDEGDGFMMAQTRLGPGRVHHCMRAIGAAESALELLCRRAQERVTFGAPVATRSNVLDWIAEARIDIEMTRLLTLKTAWMIDQMGNRNARTEIAAIKVAAPTMALRIIDRAMQIHGAAGVSGDFSLARSYAHMRCLRLADGPDEVHKLSIARHELARHAHPAMGTS